MFGHYTDHCRCSSQTIQRLAPSPSKGINEEIFQKVFQLFKIPNYKQIEFVKLVIQTLADTEFEKIKVILMK